MALTKTYPVTITEATRMLSRIIPISEVERIKREARERRKWHEKCKENTYVLRQMRSILLTYQNVYGKK